MHLSYCKDNFCLLNKFVDMSGLYNFSFSGTSDFWTEEESASGRFPNVKIEVRDVKTGFIVVIWGYISLTPKVPTGQAIDVNYVIAAAAKEYIHSEYSFITPQRAEVIGCHCSTPTLPDHNHDVDGYCTITPGLYYCIVDEIDNKITPEMIIGFLTEDDAPVWIERHLLKRQLSELRTLKKR